MKKLPTDNPFFEFMGNIGDWILLNLLFILTSIPIVTIGMSLTSLYRIVLRRVRGENNYVCREYFKACREEWKKSTVLWILFLAAALLLQFDLTYVKHMWKWLTIALWVLVVLVSFIFSYAFPLQARFENSIKNTLINALVLSVKYLPYTICIVVLNAIPVFCLASGIFATRMAMPVYFFFGFALTARINCIFFSKIFDRFMNRDETRS